MNSVCILMATYNGAKYLPAQIRSLQQQTYVDWQLFVQDDLSLDETLNVLQQFAQEDLRIHVLPNQEKLGAMENFARLMAYAEGFSYYFFCDQDDVWLPTKIERTLQVLQQAEKNAPKGTPVLAHTDLRVVDADENELAPSLWQMFRIEPDLLRTLFALGGHCLATGCTMAINDAARRLSLPIPREAIMHDSWIVLRVAQAKGVLCEWREPTILYRQHGRNTLGAKDFRTNYIQGKLLHLFDVLRDQYKYYRMLRKVNFGSPLRFYWSKWKYYHAYNALRK